MPGKCGRFLGRMLRGISASLPAKGAEIQDLKLSRCLCGFCGQFAPKNGMEPLLLRNLRAICTGKLKFAEFSANRRNICL